MYLYLRLLSVFIPLAASCVEETLREQLHWDFIFGLAQKQDQVVFCEDLLHGHTFQLQSVSQSAVDDSVLLHFHSGAFVFHPLACKVQSLGELSLFDSGQVLISMTLLKMQGFDSSFLPPVCPECFHVVTSRDHSTSMQWLQC